MEITNIEKCKRAKGRYNIYIDDKFGFSLSETVLSETCLKSGLQVDIKKIEELKYLDERKKALESAFNFLSYRSRSEKELKDKLETKKYSTDIIVETVEKLKSLKLLDDSVFAKRWVEERKDGRGKVVLKTELYKLGIAKDIVFEAVGGLQGEEFEIAERLVEKKKSFSKLKDKKDIYTKIGGFLLRRGFSYETVKKIIESKIKKSP